MTIPEVSAEHREKEFNAYEALTRYRNLDPSVQAGALSPQQYDGMLELLTEVPLTPEQSYDAACIQLELAMAIAGSAVDLATELPYTTKQINAAYDSAIQSLQRLTANEHAPDILRAQARMMRAAVGQYRELVTSKPHMANVTPYRRYLETTRELAGELWDKQDLTAEETRFIHGISAIAILTYGRYEFAWFLPALSRQPWDVSMYDTHYPETIPLYIGSGEDDDAVHVLPGTFAGGMDDPFAIMRAYARIEPADFTQGRSRPSFSRGSSQARHIMQNAQLRGQVLNFGDLIAARALPVHRRRIEALLSKQNTPEVVEQPPHRDLSEAAKWYLLDFDGAALDDLEQAIFALEALRAKGSILAEERMLLGWATLDRARLMALAAGKDKRQLDTAREAYTPPIKHFEATTNQFKRLRRPGEANDAALAALMAQLQRGLYTSMDKYAVRRIVRKFHEDVGTLLVSAKLGSPETIFLEHTVSRATLSLLQASASPDMRHLLVPTSPRLSDRQVAEAYPIIVGDNANSYEFDRPVAIQLIDGNEIVATGPRQVVVGREALIIDEDPLRLLRMLGAYLAQQAAKQPPKLNKRAEELSMQLAGAISDASDL